MMEMIKSVAAGGGLVLGLIVGVFLFMAIVAPFALLLMKWVDFLSQWL